MFGTFFYHPMAPFNSNSYHAVSRANKFGLLLSPPLQFVLKTDLIFSLCLKTAYDSYVMKKGPDQKHCPQTVYIPPFQSEGKDRARNISAPTLCWLLGKKLKNEDC